MSRIPSLRFAVGLSQRRALAYVLLIGVVILGACRWQLPAAGGSKAVSSVAESSKPSERDPSASPESNDPAREPPAASEAEPTADGTNKVPLRSDGTVAGETELMGTRMSIVVWVPEDQSSSAAGTAVQAAFNEIARIEAIASEWRAESDLSRLNRNAGRGLIAVAPELVEILRRSKEISAETDGNFDVSFHAVGQLWKFAKGAKPPSDAAIAEALPHVNWRNIVIGGDGRSVRLKDPLMRIGLGAIAKGYGVDAASAVLVAHGFPDHIVEGGGDTYVSGSKNGEPWLVGIQNPNGPGSIGAIPARDVAVVTSGNYERYFEMDGVRFSHIIDPKTGRPIPEARSPRSVTLMAQNATTADSLCTALAVMGPQSGMQFVESRPDLDAVFVTSSGEMLVSTGLRERFRAMRAPSEAEAGPRAPAGAPRR